MSSDGGDAPGRSARIALGIVSLLPIYVIVFLIERYAVNVPVWDSWAWGVSRFVADDLPNLRIGAFWELRNEHRLFVPQLLETFIGHLTSLNMVALMYVKLACTAVLFLALVRLFTRSSPGPSWAPVAIAFSLWLFSLAQWPRWIDSRHLPTTLAMTGLALGAWALHSGTPSWRRLLLAAVAAYLSSLSYFSGNFTWIALGVLLWTCGYRRRAHFVAWAAMAMSVWVPYAIDFASAKSLTRETAAPGVGDVVQFVLVFLGSPLVGTDRLAENQTPALLFGALGLVTCAAIGIGARKALEDGVRKTAPWLVLAAWVAVSASAAGYGRFAQFGLSGARSIRYVVYGCFFWLAVSALLAIALTGRRRSEARTALSAWPSAVLVLVALGYVQGTLALLANGRFTEFSERLARGRHCLTTPDIANNTCLGLLSPKPDYVRSLLPELQRRRVSFLYLETPLRFDDALVQGRFQSRAEERRVVASGRAEDAIVAPAPTFVTWRRVHLPKASSITLRTGAKVGLLERENESLEPVEFAVSVIQSGELTELVTAEASPAAEPAPFQQLDVDLTPFGGRVVDLQLHTRRASAVGPAEYQSAYWLAPEIVYGEPSP